MLMGFREYARHRGVALRAVQKAIEAGRIQTVGEGRDRKIDAELADRAWSDNTDPARQSLLHTAGPQAGAGPAARASDAGSQAGPADAGAAPEDDEPPAPNDSAEYRAARTAREQVRLQRDQLALQQELGSVVQLADAGRLLFTAFRTLRDSVLNVPARVRDQVASLTDAAAIEQLLDAELATAVSVLNPERVLIDADEDEDDDDAV